MNADKQKISNSHITNKWGQVELNSVKAEHSVIYYGEENASYNHHSSLTSMNGRLYATWSNGFRDEDQLGQRMMLATSNDQGATWSRPRPIVDHQPTWRKYGVVTSEGIHEHKGKLAAFYGYSDISKKGLLMYYTMGGNMFLPLIDQRAYLNSHTGIMVSVDAGDTWEGPVTKIDGFVTNHLPRTLSNGRLILAGHLAYPYTDDPFGIKGWKKAMLPRLPEDYIDDTQGYLIGMKYRRDNQTFCEGCFFEMDDGTIRMMLRADGKKRLAVSESKDHGETWSEPQITNYSDCDSRSYFGRLPDGRYYGVNCPEPNSPRTPLVLATSKDGTVFDTHYILGDESCFLARYLGIHKYGRYGYPSCHIINNMMYVIYSINKEDIALCRFPISELK